MKSIVESFMEFRSLHEEDDFNIDLDLESNDDLLISLTESDVSVGLDLDLYCSDFWLGEESPNVKKAEMRESSRLSFYLENKKIFNNLEDKIDKILSVKYPEKYLTLVNDNIKFTIKETLLKELYNTEHKDAKPILTISYGWKHIKEAEKEENLCTLFQDFKDYTIPSDIIQDHYTINKFVFDEMYKAPVDK